MPLNRGPGQFSDYISPPIAPETQHLIQTLPYTEMEMTQTVPIPASTARKLALTAFNGADKTRKKGHRATANRIESSAESILDVATENKGGRFVSVDGRDLSAIAAYGSLKPSMTARVFLEQYNVWD